MIKVRKDMSPVVGELQRLALIFCEQDEEKLSLLDDMKCAIEDSMQSKPVCKMVGVKTIHSMAQLLGDSISMVATLAHRYCQSNLDQVQLLQKWRKISSNPREWPSCNPPLWRQNQKKWKNQAKPRALRLLDYPKNQLIFVL